MHSTKRLFRQNTMCFFVLWVLAISLLNGCATPLESFKKISPAPTSTFNDNSVKNTIEFSKLVFSLESGTPYGKVHPGVGCLPGRDLLWETGVVSSTEGTLVDAIRKAFSRAGIRLAGDPRQLFNIGGNNTGELVIGARVDTIDLRICGVGTYTGQKGAAYMKVEWQVYSRSLNSIVLAKTTEGSFETLEFVPQENRWLPGAIEEAAKHFLATPEVQNLFATPIMQYGSSKGTGGI